MLTKGHYDLVVVGAGPGGCTTASLVAKSGWKVLLLEKETFPRYQIGESLLPSTIHGICRLLGISSQIKKANFVRKLGGTFRWGKHPLPWTFEFGYAQINRDLDFSYAYQVKRARFDHMLLKNAKRLGVQIQEGCPVLEISKRNERFTHLGYLDQHGRKRTVQAKYFVDASGNQSRLYRNVGERLYSKFFQNVALFGYFRNGKRLPPPRGGNIFCATFREGWFWYIPLTKTLTSVGAVIDKAYTRSLLTDPEDAMRHFIDACPEIRDLLSNARRVKRGMYSGLRIRKDYSYTNTSFWTPGLILVGDSACFVDPVFSSGVHLATYGGLLAARSINSCLDGTMDEKTSFGEFELRYRHEYSAFYDFLLGFYDMHRDTKSYFWQARKVLNSKEKSNEAFLRLVAGAGTTIQDFLDLRKNCGELFEIRVDQHHQPENLKFQRRFQSAAAPAARDAFLKAREVPRITTRSIIAQAHFGEPGDARLSGRLNISKDGLHWE